MNRAARLSSTRKTASGREPFITRWTSHAEPRRARKATARPTTERTGREFARRVAGEGRRGDAGKWPKWVRNTIAHPTMAGASPERDYSGGAMRRSGGVATGKVATAIGHRPPRVGACIGTREALGTYCDGPGPPRVPEAHRRRRGPKEGDLGITVLRPRPRKSSDS